MTEWNRSCERADKQSAVIKQQRIDAWDRQWALVQKRMAMLLILGRTMAEEDMGFFSADAAGKFHKAVALLEEVAKSKDIET